MTRPIRREFRLLVDQSLGVHLRFLPDRLQSRAEDLLLMLHLVLGVDGFGTLDIQLTDLSTIALRCLTVFPDQV